MMPPQPRCCHASNPNFLFSMIPKKIYINAKTLENPKTRDGEPKAIRVKTFPSKGDAEYINVDALWHDASERPENGTNILAHDANHLMHQVFVYDGDCIFSQNCRHRHAWSTVSEWAYVTDIAKRKEASV